MSSPPDDPRTRLDEGPMSAGQWTAIAVCVLLNMLDGFDVLVMAFTADAVSDHWDLSGSQLGLLLSAGLAGMAAGSILLAPLADRIGRRATILIGLVLAAAGMGLSAAAQSPLQLGLLRVLTGIGIGAILASSNVIAAEYANRRWRGLAVSLNSTGYAVGATAGGVIAAALQSDGGGWRSVFAFGAVATALLVPVVLWRLPESLEFLLTRRSAGSLARLNKVLATMDQPAVRETPRPVHAAASAAPGLRRILAPDLRRNTLLTWTGFFLVMFGFYFVTSWTPKLLVESGMSADQGITGGVLLNLGGIFGTTLLGVLAARFALKNVLVGYTLATAVLLTLFVPATSVYGLLLALGALIGVFVNGCVAGLYALTPSIYGPDVRATGVGWGIGIGRLGAILSPIAAGRLLDAGWTPGRLFLLIAAVMIIGGGTVHAFRIKRAGRPAAAPAAADTPA
ncbi:MFS transporter [Actinomadura sp. WMMB 499]|uniref:MFS transporter n=1 Tax=Actinomadura sp. WMMB 499 TaxID=1219491 RepID=UPI001244B88D|nr:MFS transporter [Actinomadura sp. WMMB 499]QFG21284.1 MFS transporter [Actinomadura sp. WMMB 499]